MGKVCNRCGYERKPDEEAPEYKCPGCNRPYVKDASLQKQASFGGGAAQNNPEKAPAQQASPAQFKPHQPEAPPLKTEPGGMYEPRKSDDVTDRYSPAGFWIRAVAYILDNFVFVGFLAGAMFVLMMKNNRLLFYVLSGLCLLYKPCFESFFGATIGKFICGVRVKNGRGGNINIFQSFVRSFPVLVLFGSTLVFFWFAYSELGLDSMDDLKNMDPEIFIQRFAGRLGPIMLANLFFIVDALVAAFNSKKRAIHDFISGSYCVWNY